MRCLLFSVISFLLLASCASDYKHLQKESTVSSCVNKFLPLQIETSWYDASVDVMGRHISGLLLIKNMPDSSTRVVFTNEAGITYFDFAFSPDQTFTVITVVKQLRRKAVITTLRNDFALLLGLPFRKNSYEFYQTEDDFYFSFKQKKGTAYFITSKDCASLQRLEWAAKGKRMVTLRTAGSGYPLPERIELNHYTFNMQINLDRIEKE